MSLDIFTLIVTESSDLIVVAIISGFVGLLRASFPSENSNIYLAIRHVSSAIVLSILYMILILVDEGFFIKFPPVVHISIIGLISLWALDVLTWLIGFGASIRENGPKDAINGILKGGK